MTNLIALPLVVPLATASTCLLAWNQPGLQRIVSVIGVLAYLAVSILLFALVGSEGTQILAVGGWKPPFGIVLVGDATSSLLVVMTSLVGVAVVIDSLRTVDTDRVAYGYHPLVHVLLMGVSGAFLTGDLFNLYVWFEVLLISSFVLLSLGAEKAQLEASIKYVTLNLIASAIFLCALGLLYGAFGTLNLADLSLRLANDEGRGFSTPLSMMFLVAFGVKAGLVPLQAWLPASYHTPPASVSALFAGLLTKVGVVALLKFFALAFRFDPPLTDTVLAWMAALTMVLGGLGALVQMDVRRLLAYLVMNGVGTMVMGIALRTAAGSAGTFLYMIHSSLSLVAAFLLAGEIYRVGGSYDLRHLGGLAKHAPRLHVGWLIVTLSLAGVPPLSGFFGKYALIRAAIESGQVGMVVALLLSSVFVLAAVLRVWAMAFGRTEPAPLAPAKLGKTAYVLSAAVAGFAVAAPFVTRACARSGAELAEPEAYASRILEGR